MTESQEIQDSLEFVNWLIREGGLQLMKHERIRELARGGIIGCMCADGDYSLLLEMKLKEVNPRQHLLKLNGGGFLLGLDPNSGFDAATKEYLHAAQVVLKWDLTEAFHQLKKGTTVLMIAHGIHCGKAHKLEVSLSDMLLATMRADEVVTAHLEVSEDVVLPVFLMDWTPGEKGILKKKVKLYVVKKKAGLLIKRWFDRNR
ncbi:MAG: hypothetical protein COY66_02105 [Candidatus Kerfeldbacteria bacterium CG_4_10_14_0_8_um_filter_42_10]|uniref:Uncharacterized protein n=1 Tax=Candidatus Kerfeldbacteria bacterium CG_4_10_14_0_8_um_filter_42_10 TaxID=2014248 RepID=A0A2M7RJK0_9BACT|nr:MAG: hypothetical protein COY66_02105 [Candidatus Kerfeldbacteria bacterium CG_4_10_14_0_8_um_filter_42_10]